MKYIANRQLAQPDPQSNKNLGEEATSGKGRPAARVLLETKGFGLY
jgi:hypothetical protein